MEEKMENTCPHCSSCNKKVRDEKEYKDMMNRLSRIEGQVRGVKGMVENDAYCVDILTQVSAITSALNSFNKVLLPTISRPVWQMISGKARMKRWTNWSLPYRN